MVVGVGGALGFLGTAAHAQSHDGAYAGTLSCPALPGGQPLRTEFSMMVTGNKATYERAIVRPGTSGANPTGSFERGLGTVAPSGEVVLTGKCGDPFSCEAEYRGQLDQSPIRLTGPQRWRFRDRPPAERSCQVDLTPSRAR
jgi:hypothetical protein